MEDLKITDEDPGRQLSSLRPISWALGLRQLGNHAFIQFSHISRSKLQGCIFLEKSFPPLFEIR